MEYMSLPVAMRLKLLALMCAVAVIVLGSEAGVRALL